MPGMTRWPHRPTLSSSFYKAHGLGNDYLVFEAGDDWLATPERVRQVCDRHRGPGSDGIVALVERSGVERSRVSVGLRMFNPDGGEFERSGNGLRVLASHLARGDGELRRIDAEVGGATVRMTLHGRVGTVHDVSVDMGRARTGPEAVAMDAGTLLEDGRMAGPGGRVLRVVPVSVGNPHVVVFCDRADELTDELLATVGPWLATHRSLAHGTNVQLALPEDGGRCRALIWERGVGRTSASGTSACAVGVAMVVAGYGGPGALTVAMPGGELGVTVGPELDVVLRGPVAEVMDGRLADGFFD